MHFVQSVIQFNVHELKPTFTVQKWKLRCTRALIKLNEFIQILSHGVWWRRSVWCDSIPRFQYINSAVAYKRRLISKCLSHDADPCPFASLTPTVDSGVYDSAFIPFAWHHSSFM